MAFVLQVDVFLQMSKGPIVAEVENWDLGIELSYCGNLFSSLSTPVFQIAKLTSRKFNFPICQLRLAICEVNIAHFSAQHCLVQNAFPSCQFHIAILLFCEFTMWTAQMSLSCPQN